MRAGTDVWLFNGLLAFLHQHGVVRREFVASSTQRTRPCTAGRASNTAGDVRVVAKTCGIDERSLAEFYRLFARTEKTLTDLLAGRESVLRRHRQGQQHHQLPPADRAHRSARHGAVLHHRPAERDGRARSRRPREHARRAHGARRSRTIGASCSSSGTVPRIADAPGLKAVDLFDAIHDGRVKAVWIMATNPVVSLPDADKVKEALRRCELVVVSDCVATHRHERASRTCCCRPPAGARRTARSPTPSDASRASAPSCRARRRRRPDWWIISRKSRSAWAYAQGFAFASAHEIFVEHARLSGAENDGARAFDIGGLAHADRAANTTRSRRSSGRSPCERAPRHRATADRRAFLPPRRQSALRRDAAASRPSTRPTTSIRWCSTPAASATSGTR